MTWEQYCSDKAKLKKPWRCAKRPLDMYMYKKTIGSDHAEVADTYNNIGKVFAKPGKLEEAKEM